MASVGVSPAESATIAVRTLLRVALLVALATTFAVVHVKLERTFHFWDFDNYHASVRQATAEFRSSPVQGVKSVGRSLFGNRPTLWILPLLPLTMTLGDSRALYIAALVLVYQVPYFLLLGGLGASLMRGGSSGWFWACTGLAALIPAVWLSTLLGWPDVSAASLIALAMLLYVHPASENRRVSYLGVGAALGMAILFRRHYAYSAIAFFGAVGLDAIVIAAGGREDSIRRGLARMGQIAIAGLGAVAVMSTIGAPFTMHALSLDVAVLYQSYEESLLTNLAYFTGLFGGTLVAVSIAGWIAAFLLGSVVQDRARPIALFFVLEVSLWFFLVSETNPQFVLHFTSFIALGLALGLRAIVDRAPRRVRFGMPIAAAAVLLATLLLSLVPVSTVADLPGRSWWIARQRPLQRGDYAEVVRLVETLRRYASPTEPVFVAASSYVLNRSILATADQTMPPRPGLLIAAGPDVDSRDYLPLSGLMLARFVVVATPVQYHLRAEEQDVVRLAHEALTTTWEIGRDFERLPEEFSLQGATATIYRRTKSSDLTAALSALDRMEKELGSRPAGQTDWLSIDSVTGAGTEDTGDASHLFAQLGPEGTRSGTFVYLNALPPRFTVRGRMILPASDMMAVGLRLFVLNSAGVKEQVQDMPPQLADGRPFEIAFTESAASRLILEPYTAAPVGRRTPLALRSVRIDSR